MSSVGIALFAVALCVVFAVWMTQKEKRTRAALSWPSTDATIQSGAVEEVAAYNIGGRNTIDLPCFAFSYVVDGEYYSGRFALRAGTARHEELIQKMIDRKIRVNFDPKSPSRYYLPYESIEGCKVEQKINADALQMHPLD
jgi:hypothetical protein